MATDLVVPGRICERTGLALLPATGQKIWRIAKTSYGALNPLVREAGDHRGDWGRYDVVEHRTVYGAAPEEASYAEALAALRPKFTVDGPKLSDLFDDVSADDPTTLLEVVDREWRERHHMPPAHVPAGWRFERLLYELRLPKSGWFIDIERAESISAISQALSADLAKLKLKALTVGDLRGERRDVTTRVAEWLWSQELDDGSRAHGIQFGSKHDSTWACWAVWLRAMDTGKPRSAEPTKSNSGTPIEDCEHNEALAYVAQLFNLRCF